MPEVAVRSVERSSDNGTAVVTIGLELSDTSPDAADAFSWVHT
jgi:hypothetical protein